MNGNVEEVNVQLTKVYNDSDMALEEKDDKLFNLLKTLQNVTMNVELLKKTKIGLVVGKLRKYENAKVATYAKCLLKEWKNIAKSPRVSSQVVVKNPNIVLNPKVGLNSMREKVIAKLVETMKVHDCSSDEKLMDKHATFIEEAMAARYKLHTKLENKKEYSSKYRQLQFNLKKNKRLVQQILNGSIHAKDLITMSADDLATEARRKETEKLRDDAFQRSRLDWAEANADKINEQCGIKDGESGLFTCGRCKSSKTSNTQKQTRSADEPMTVFVLCHNCGKRWKC